MAKAGLELVAPRASELSKTTSVSLERRLLAYLIPESNQSQDFFRAFFDNTVRSTYWDSVLEFAVCQGGAFWLLSLYWPRLIARLSAVSDLSAAVSEDERKSEVKSVVAESSIVAEAPVSNLTYGERSILNSRDGILLVLSVLDSAKETRQQSVDIVVNLSKLAGVHPIFTRGDSSNNPLCYAAAKNRSDICTFIMPRLGASVNSKNEVFNIYQCFSLLTFSFYPGVRNSVRLLPIY